LSRKCAKDKMWITRGIKRSSNHKNKLYKKWVCSHDTLDEQNYRDYLIVCHTSDQCPSGSTY